MSHRELGHSLHSRLRETSNHPVHSAVLPGRRAPTAASRFSKTFFPPCTLGARAEDTTTLSSSQSNSGLGMRCTSTPVTFGGDGGAASGRSWNRAAKLADDGLTKLNLQVRTRCAFKDMLGRMSSLAGTVHHLGNVGLSQLQCPQGLKPSLISDVCGRPQGRPLQKSRLKQNFPRTMSLDCFVTGHRLPSTIRSTRTRVQGLKP